MNWNRVFNKVFFRSGRRWDGPVCNAQHPIYGGWGRYAVKRTRKGDVPQFRKPLAWIQDTDDEGHWEFK